MPLVVHSQLYQSYLVALIRVHRCSQTGWNTDSLNAPMTCSGYHLIVDPAFETPLAKILRTHTLTSPSLAHDRHESPWPYLSLVVTVPCPSDVNM